MPFLFFIFYFMFSSYSWKRFIAKKGKTHARIHGILTWVMIAGKFSFTPIRLKKGKKVGIVAKNTWTEYKLDI